ncbi:MAG TPA: hypothetical protein VMV49_00705, partial [Candidatus Deferrimicrobium sp.]|nr:hypothetical protein [Candidatus Deferrimicrobium sp.]
MQELSIGDLLGVIFVLTAMILTITIGIKSFKVYRQNKLTTTLLIAFAGIFIGLAMLFLVLERAILLESLPIYNKFLGLYVFGSTAVVISGIAVFFIDSFSFKMAFPKKSIILSIISASLIILYLSFRLFDSQLDVIGGEIVVSNTTQLITYCTLIPLIIIPNFVFFYFAARVRHEDP